MQKLILEKLKLLEAKHQIRILFAIESGSRAWGFPSPDSDYDVRFIYAHPVNHYLSLYEHEDYVDLPVNDLLDINGWDIRKALRLTAKSNAVVFEWLQSPIVYQVNKEFHDAFLEIAPDCFSPIAAMHHYLSMAKKKYEECITGEKVKLKRYMYCLRAVLSGLWIARKKTIPPMEIIQLLPEVKDAELESKIIQLINLKAGQDESYLHEHEPELEHFLQAAIDECQQVALSLPSQKADFKKLDSFFIKTISEQ